MLGVASLATRLRTSVSRVSFLVLALTLGSSGAATARTWQVGDVITFSQAARGDDPTASTILINNYDAVYASNFGILEVGIPGVAGLSIQFTAATRVLDYPLQGFFLPGPLTSDHLGPTSTESEDFGGEVTALKLNIDFSDAGLILGALGIPFGDLILTNFDHVPFVGDLPPLNGLGLRSPADRLVAAPEPAAFLPPPRAHPLMLQGGAG